MSRKNTLIAAATVALLAAGGLGFYFYQQSQDGTASHSQQAADNAGPAAPAAAAGAKGPLPAPVFLVLDKQAVLRFSKAGQDLARQMEPLVAQARNNIQAQRASLQSQADALRNDTSLTPAEHDKRVEALQTKAAALEGEAQRKQAQLAEMLNRANDPISKAMSEIVPAILKERGANIVLDRAAIAQADPAFDITPDVIKQLDARLPSVTLNQNAPLAAAK